MLTYNTKLEIATAASDILTLGNQTKDNSVQSDFCMVVIVAWLGELMAAQATVLVTLRLALGRGSQDCQRNSGPGGTHSTNTNVSDIVTGGSQDFCRNTALYILELSLL